MNLIAAFSRQLLRSAGHRKMDLSPDTMRPSRRQYQEDRPDDAVHERAVDAIERVARILGHSVASKRFRSSASF